MHLSAAEPQPIRDEELRMPAHMIPGFLRRILSAFAFPDPHLFFVSPDDGAEYSHSILLQVHRDL